MITVSKYRCYHTVLSFKSRPWQFGLTLLLLGLTYLLSLTSTIRVFEYDLLLYLLQWQPLAWGTVAVETIQLASRWYLLPVYGVILVVCNQSANHAVSELVAILMAVLALIGILALEVLLVVFTQYFLPMAFPSLAMLILLLSFRFSGLYAQVTDPQVNPATRFTLTEIRRCLEKGNLDTAAALLKSCPYSDELLEVGCELGLLLESGKQWSSALDLYRWLEKYDPGVAEFVSRVEKIVDTEQASAGKESQGLPREPAEIGHYKVLKRIARGATAVIYEAIDKRNYNRVALKVMRVKPSEKVDRERVRHWLHEAEIVSQLDHDNIVKIHDAELLADSAYIAMDYVQGYSMSSRLRKQEYLTAGECIRISKDVLRALIVAHDHGVIHGDIKPANIMYDSVHDAYILTDFGAACSNRQDRLNENMIVGTPAYMSPEQLESKKLDGRSDLFSLAVTLYHLFTGHQPFTGSNLPELKHNIVTSEPDLNHLSLPAGIIEVLIKALQKKPYMRFADAKQMLTSVEYCEEQLRDRMRQLN